MAKQFGFEQLFRQRAAVDRHERFIMTRAGVMDRTGDDLLPVPLWPLISTLTSDCATIPACSSRRSISGLRVTIARRRFVGGRRALL